MQVFYVPGETRLIDVLSTRTGMSHYSKRTFLEMKKKYPEVVLEDYDEVLKQIEAAQEKIFIKPLAEISEDRFYEMLEVLPPLHHQYSDGVESFCLCEFITDDITGMYFRIGTVFETGRCYTATDRIHRYPEIRKEVLRMKGE